MAIAVDVRRVDHQQVGLEFADHGAGAGGNKLVAVGMRAVHLHPQVGINALFHHLGRAAGVQEAIPHTLVLGLRPIFIDQIINALAVARHRPEHRRRSQPRRLRRVEDGGRLHVVIEPMPRRGLLLQVRQLVIDNAVTVRIAACHHGGMAGIGQGRIDGAHMPHASRVLPYAAEHRQLAQGQGILINQCVLGNNDHMLAHRFNSPLTK